MSETDSPSPRRIALSQLKLGQGGVVRAVRLGDPSEGDPAAGTAAIQQDAARDAAYLGAMGLCCNAKVRLCRAGEPCIVAIVSGTGASCRIGLARPLADRIIVEPE